jgi:hypothetical protein
MRRPTIAVLSAVVAVLVLFSCSDQPSDGYTWQKTVPELSKYEWHVLAVGDLVRRCNFAPGINPSACVERHWGTDTCHVFAHVTEDQARRLKPAGTFGKTTLFEHEVGDNSDLRKATLGHCAGFDHKEAYLPAPGAHLWTPIK